MQFIANFWWLWGIALVLSAFFLVRRMFGHVKNPLSLLGGSVQNTFLAFVPVWVSGGLFALSIVLNIIQFAQGS